MKNGSSAIEDSLGAAIMETLLHSFVSDGRIDPKNLTDQQIRKEFVKQLKIFLSQKTLLGSVDHRSNILKKARSFAEKEEFEYACLFYATWFEHWINSTVSKLAAKECWTQEQLDVALRDCSLKAKYICILPALKFSTIPNHHLKAILRISELRNAFVHYKFKAIDINTWTDENKIWIRDLERAKLACSYLVRRERAVVYSNSKRRLSSAIRKNKS